VSPPLHDLQSAVDFDRQAIGLSKRFDNSVLLVEDFCPQFASLSHDIDEKMFAAKAHGPGHEPAFGGAGIHRGETISPQGSQARAASSRSRGTTDTAPAADVEIKFISHDQAASAGRLDIAPVPVADIL